MKTFSGTRIAGADKFSVATIFRISSGVRSPASAVPGIRYFPIAIPPIKTGSYPISRIRREATAIAWASSPAIGMRTCPGA